MLNKIWQWLKRFFQRLLGIAPPPPPPPPPPKPIQTLSDAEYEAIFMQLLEGVKEGWSRGFVTGFLSAKRISDAEWIAWLRRFEEKLLATELTADEVSPPGTETPSIASLRELARRVVQFGELRGEEFGEAAQEIGKRILNRLPPPPAIEEESGKGEIIEAVFIGDGLNIPENKTSQTTDFSDRNESI